MLELNTHAISKMIIARFSTLHLIAGDIKKAGMGNAVAHPAKFLLRRRVHERHHGDPEKIPSKSTRER